MNPVLVRRLVGAATVFAVLLVVAGLLPSPECDCPKVETPASPELKTDVLQARQPPPRVLLDRADREPASPPPAQEPERPPQARPDTAAEAPATEPAAVPPKPRPAVPAQAEPRRAPAASRESAPAPPEPPAVEIPGGPWRVQVASFSERERAERVIDSFRAQGLRCFRESVTVGGRVMHRVLLGPFASEAEAQAARRAAVAAGFADARIRREE